MNGHKKTTQVNLYPGLSRPTLVSDPRLLDFNCPLCGSNNCKLVSIRRPNGSDFVTEFFQCVSYSVMFTNPVEFIRLTRDTFTGTWRERYPTREYLLGSDGRRKKEEVSETKQN